MLVSSFIGSNREFRKWLEVRTGNVGSLADYRKKKKAASKAARIISHKPIIA